MSIAPGSDGTWNQPSTPFSLPFRRLRLAPPPMASTPLLGRDAEMAAVFALLASDNVRLVTLVGPGGIGKTRLAQSIAAGIAEGFDDQVAWAPVTTAATPEAVAAMLAHAIGMDDMGFAPVVESLKGALRDMRLLLVIDNFEQAIDAAPLLSDLLQACPQLSLLVTSRALLRIEGEHPIDIQPLATEVASSGGAVGSDPAPAVELFAQRAASVAPSFVLTPENTPVVAEICRRLDGLPLAIELAAARSRLLAPVELLARLGHRLPNLTTGLRDAPARHRTMRDAIAWSYDLLSPAEQSVFCELSVFAGGCSLEAAEAVCRTSPVDEPGMRAADLAPDVTSLIESLVAQSLVQVEVVPASEGAARRLGMLETVREFAVEQLDASGDDGPGRRHAGYYLELALRVERTHWGDEPGDLRGQVRVEEANLRAATSWAIAHGETDTALWLATAIFDPLSHTGDSAREQYTWLQRALALPGGSPSARTFALTRSAGLVRLDELAEGDALAGEALALARRHDDAFGSAEAQRVLGNIAIHTGDRHRARSCLLEALAGFRELGHPGRTGWTLLDLSVLEGSGAEEDSKLAASYCDEAQAIFRELEHVRGIEAALNWRAQCAYKLGDLAGALESAREGLAMTTSDSWTFDYLDCFADIAELIGQAETAATLYGAVDALRERAAKLIEPVFRAARDARIDVARRALGDEAFASAYAAGRALTVEQAVAEALAVEMPPDLDAREPVVSSPVQLSRRELEVMRLLATGLSDRVIGETLFIGERTVNTHVAHIFTKLGVRNRAAAVTAAVAAGLVDPDSVGSDSA